MEQRPVSRIPWLHTKMHRVFNDKRADKVNSAPRLEGLTVISSIS